MPRTALLLLLPLLLLASACGDAVAPPADAATAGVRVVGAAEAAELLSADPDRVIIDLRTPAEFAEGHLAGATLIDVQAPDFADRVAVLDRDASYLVYCRSGNRSQVARAVMADMGFADVVDIDGGILAWSAAGLPTTS